MFPFCKTPALFGSPPRSRFPRPTRGYIVPTGHDPTKSQPPQLRAPKEQVCDSNQAINKKATQIAWLGRTQRRARDSNPQPRKGHLISSQAAHQFAYPPSVHGNPSTTPSPETLDSGSEPVAALDGFCRNSFLLKCTRYSTILQPRVLRRAWQFSLAKSNWTKVGCHCWLAQQCSQATCLKVFFRLNCVKPNTDIPQPG